MCSVRLGGNTSRVYVLHVFCTYSVLSTLQKSKSAIYFLHTFTIQILDSCNADRNEFYSQTSYPISPLLYFYLFTRTLHSSNLYCIAGYKHYSVLLYLQYSTFYLYCILSNFIVFKFNFHKVGVLLIGRTIT